MSKSQTLVLAGAQAAFADSAEFCYETTFDLEIIITKESCQLLRVCQLQKPPEAHSLNDRILLNFGKIVGFGD